MTRSLTLILASLVGTTAFCEPPPRELRVRVIRSFPHDPEAWTQGLLAEGGKLYESTGLYGRSSVRRVDLETGTIESRAELDRGYFGEGLARVEDRLYQLTWQNGVALVWNIEMLKMEGQFIYQGEGWGLCFDGKHLAMSDGSDRLVFRDPATFAPVREVRVRLGGKPLELLNELECVGESIYANVWGDDHIARIDAATGEVTAWIDASGLLSPGEQRHSEAVLNGIAHLPETGHFLLTGKLWPRIFEVEFIPRERSRAVRR